MKYERSQKEYKDLTTEVKTLSENYPIPVNDYQTLLEEIRKIKEENREMKGKLELLASHGITEFESRKAKKRKN